MTSLSVLITNITLAGRTGTEVVVRDLAVGLVERGHKPVVYSPVISGPVVRELRAASVPVTDDILSIERRIDIIHGHHTPTTAVAMARFPEAPAIFVCHDFVAWHDLPPALPRLRKVVAVDETVLDRVIAEAGIPIDHTALIPNAVDCRRHADQGPLPHEPTRALLVAKGYGYADKVREACELCELELEAIGASVGRLVNRPEEFATGKHIVFASARNALEAMASGCAVISCDGRGLAGMVTQRNFSAWRTLNFGLRTLRRELSVENLVSEIRSYDATDARLVTERVRRESNTEDWVSKYLALYAEAIRSDREAPPTGDAIARALSHQMQQFIPRPDAAYHWMEERAILRRRIQKLEAEAESRAAGLPHLPREAPLRFANGEAALFASLWGFSAFEDWGVWTAASDAGLVVRAPARGDDEDIGVKFDLVAFVPSRTPPLSVKVSANDVPVAEWLFTDDQRHTRLVQVRRALVPPNGATWFRFQIMNARSPAEVGLGADSRKLGIGLIALRLRNSGEVLEDQPVK